MSGFSWVKSVDGRRDIIKRLQVGASATIVKGDALEFTDGKVKRVSAAADVVQFIALEDAVTSSTDLTFINCVQAAGSGGIFKVGITPLVNTTANSGSTTTALVALTDGSSSDLVGGYIWVSSAGSTKVSQRIITANTYSGNVVTVTWVEPLSQAVASGDTVRIVPFGLSEAAVKLHASTFYNTLSVVRGDETGGKVSIYEVDLPNNEVLVTFAS